MDDPIIRLVDTGSSETLVILHTNEQKKKIHSYLIFKFVYLHVYVIHVLDRIYNVTFPFHIYMPRPIRWGGYIIPEHKM